MKPKILYISLAILIVLILISILIKREGTRINPALKEKESPQTIKALLSELPKFSSSSVNNPAITVISPPVKEIPQKASVLATQGSTVSTKKVDASPSKATSSITKIGKYPSEIENDEMNKRGIVMY